MKKIQVLIFALSLAVLGSCEDEPKQVMDNAVQPVSTFYLIRHAEKDRSNPSDNDPELTQQGLGRAMHWAEILDDVPLDAIYTTDYQRTSMTAAPASVKQDINVTYYQPGQVDIEQFKADNLGKNVLVVGHSNTTPEFVNALIGTEKYAPIRDDENGNLFIVQLVGDTATDLKLEFNCNCPD